jgi:hypothetical protein
MLVSNDVTRKVGKHSQIAMSPLAGTLRRPDQKYQPGVDEP